MAAHRLNAEMMVRAVRPVNLQPVFVAPAERDVSGAQHYGFILGFAAIVAALLLPTSLLVHFGLASDDPGGNPLTKFLPSTYLAVLAGGIALFGNRRDRGLTRLFHDSPGLGWSIILILFCAIYSVLSVGISGVAIYVNTYLAAMLVAVATMGGTPRQCRILGYTLLTIAVINIFISLIEGATLTHFLPLDPGLQQSYESGVDTGIDEFRGQAFYEHPLAGALVTGLTLFLLLGMKLRTWIAAVLFTILTVGLLSFGGRAALITSLAIIAVVAVGRFAIALVRRRLSLSFLAAILAGALLLPAVLFVVLSFTDVGTRITSHLYMDDSADVRVIQWRILDMLDLKQTLLGTPPPDIEAMKAQIGLASPGTDIESFALLIFLNLGLVGFPFYVLSLALFMLHLGARSKSSFGWFMVLAALIICSTSNSLGRKVPDLLFLTGLAVGLSGFATKPERAVSEAATRPVEPLPRRSRSALTPVVSLRMRALTVHPKG